MQTGPGDKPVPTKKVKVRAHTRTVQVKPPAGDIASSGGDYGSKQANEYKKTKAYRGAVRAGYKGNQNRSQAVRDNANAANNAGAATPEQVAVVKTHLDALRGNRKNARSSAGKDTKGNADRARALKFLADHPEILKPPKPGAGHAGGILGTIDSALSGKLTAGAVDVAKAGITKATPALLAAARGPIGIAGDIGIKKLTGLDVEKHASDVPKPIGRDVVDIPANTIPSLYVPTRETLSGHPDKAAKMLAQPFIDTAEHPIKSLKEHPVGTVLIARGIEGGLGHGIGKALRTAPSKAAKKAGSLERGSAEIANANTHLREDRTYSKDAFIKAGQVLRDKRRAAKGKEAVGGHITSADIERRTNERVAANEDVRRANRATVVHDARTALDQRGPMAKLKGHRPTAATTAMAQHIADTPEELAAYLDALKESAKGLEGDKLRRNHETQALIAKALKHPGRLARNAEQAAKYRDLNLRIQGELEKTGIIDPKQMENRRLLSYATSPAKGMNARMLQPHETEAAVKRAVEHRDAAKKDLKRAKRDLAKAQAGEAEMSGRAQILSRNVEGRLASSPGATPPRARPAPRTATRPRGGHGIAEAASRRSAAEARVEEARQAVKHADKQVAKARKIHQQGGHLVDENGARVTNADIRAHMAQAGVDGEGAYVTHAPGKRGARNFYVATDKAPGHFGPKATGAAVKEGTLDLHPESMVESVAHAQGLVDAAHRFRGFVDEFAHRKPSGKLHTFKTFQEAQDAAREMMVNKDGSPVPHALEMRPVRLNPLGGRGEQLRATLDETNHAAAGEHMRQAVDEALSGRDTGKGDWALVPAKAADVQREHLGVGSTKLGKIGQLYGSQFRKVVLSLSPKWLTGNVVEAALRSLVGHAGPRSYYTGRRAQQTYEKTYGKEAAAELRSRTTGGGHYSLAHRTDVRRTAEDIANDAGDRLAKFSVAMGKLRRAPVAKQVAGAWDLYTHIVMQSLNGRLEHQFQTAMFGKALRDHPLMSDHTIKLSKAAIDDAAKGLHDTNAQVRLGREVDRMYGRYAKFSPSQRRLIAGYTPFIAWSLNTVRFLFDVLPVDHPVLTAVLASANQASEEWRTQHGLIKSFVENLPGANPDFLQGAIPGKDGSFLRASHFTPFGIYDQEGGLLAAFSNALLPQAEGALANIEGKDWRGKSLSGTDPTKSPTQARDLLAAGHDLPRELGAVPVGGRRRRGHPHPERARRDRAPGQRAVAPAQAQRPVHVLPEQGRRPLEPLDGRHPQRQGQAAAAAQAPAPPAHQVDARPHPRAEARPERHQDHRRQGRRVADGAQVRGRDRHRREPPDQRPGRRRRQLRLAAGAGQPVPRPEQPARLDPPLLR
jgi:hypothetical protein